MARYHDGIIREDDIYKWIISPEGKKATKYEITPLELAKEIKKISKRYADLVVATELIKDGGEFPNITNIGFINKYKSRQHLILLLALDLNTTKEEIEFLGQQIESFFFYSNTLGIQAKNNERLFSQWANMLRGKKTITEIASVIESTMVPYIKDKVGQFKSVFLNIRHEAFNPLYRQRYILGKIENSILQKSGLPVKGKNFLDNLQIEHILPQTPKDGIELNDFEDHNDYYEFVYKLGNVTLLEGTINQAVNNFNDLSSDWFEKKQSEYVNSNVVSTNLLNDRFSIGNNTALNRFKNDYKYSFTFWNKQSISERQKILMELALDTWRFNDQRIDK
jgi:hypothetical protein